MPLQNLNQEVANKVDLNYLLIHFTIDQLAKVLGVEYDYLNKVRNLQRIEGEINFKTNNFSDNDEMKLGRVGSWKLSVERTAIKQFKNENYEG